jgi:Icc-related predicted phosphoesterase
VRLLLFSDLHADAAAARRLVGLARTADAVVGAGDFANARRDIELTLDVLRAIPRPAVLVPGNNETADELRAAVRGWPSAVVLHGDGATVGGVPFFGLGGGVPVTPFGAWSYDFTEERAAAMLRDAPAGCVLVTHSPPKGACDVASSGKSLGSTAVRDAVARLAPRLVVCGHVHACGGTTAAVGGTPVVNAGPNGAWWELPAG